MKRGRAAGERQSVCGAYLGCEGLLEGIHHGSERSDPVGVQRLLNQRPFVAGQLGDTRAAVVATYREPELDPNAPEWAALADVVRRASLRLSLRGLGEPEVADYIFQVADEMPSRQLVAAIAAETEGNPLFVGEIVRLLATEGKLPVPSGDDWRPTIPNATASGGWSS